MRDLVAELKALTKTVCDCQDNNRLYREDGSIIAYATDYANGLTIKQHIAGEIADFAKDKGNLGSSYGHLLEAALHLVQAADYAWRHFRYCETDTDAGRQLVSGVERNYDQHANLVRKALAAIEA